MDRTNPDYPAFVIANEMLGSGGSLLQEFLQDFVKKKGSVMVQVHICLFL